ncbi:MAG: glutamine-hydrolyzing carbamoyl-phosphate synthase small subunit [Rickettsiaceae bacterium]
MTFNSDAILLLSNGIYFLGRKIGLQQKIVGEICFNTSMMGYQEVITDPSYAEQLVVFSFPHIGNVGTNALDAEFIRPNLKGIILGDSITLPSNYRSEKPFLDWLNDQTVNGIYGVDTRQIIRCITESSKPLFAMIKITDTIPDEKNIQDMLEEMNNTQPLSGSNLIDIVGCSTKKHFNNTNAGGFSIAVIDYGVKSSILKCLSALGCSVSCYPATASIDSVLKDNPDGIVLSNGPGDPCALKPEHYLLVTQLLKTKLPLMGICFGYQLLALSLGATIKQMLTGHHGINHPVIELKTQKVLITSQNHEFAVQKEDLPDSLEATHISLFDDTLEGIKVKGEPVFGIQFHPEASPGPLDASYLFNQFLQEVSYHAKES